MQRHKLALVPLFETFASTKVTRWRRFGTTLAAKRSATVPVCSWLPILHKTLGCDFLGNCGLVRSEFPVGIRPVFINLPRETGVRKFFWSLENDVWVNIKEEFAWNNCGCLLNFSEGNVPKPGNETRSVRPSRKYRFKYLNFGNSNRNFWSNWTYPIYISTTKRPITA